MTRLRAVFLSAALTVLALCALARPACARRWRPPRTLDELKEEVQARAARKGTRSPHSTPTEVREALSNLKSLERDEWAAVWSAIGDRHLGYAKNVPRY
jgi:hypothetical protein